MIDFVHGDILQAETDALVNTVNTVGVMGKGVALQFKRRFPDNFAFYREACERGEVQPGKMLVFPTGRIQPRYFINFPIKRRWRQKSRIEDIKAGLDDLVLQDTSAEYHFYCPACFGMRQRWAGVVGGA